MLKQRSWELPVIFMCLSHVLYGQGLISEKGTFQVNTSFGCAPLFVETNDISGTQNAYCFQNCSVSEDCNSTSDPDAFEDVFDFTYTSPGTYRISKLANDTTGAPFIDCITIQVLEPDTEPQLTLAACAFNQLFVSLDDDPIYDAVVIDIPTLGITNDTVLNNNAEIYAFSTSQIESISYQGIFFNGTNNCQTFTSQVQLTSDLLPAETVSTEVPLVSTDSGRVALNFNLPSGAVYAVERSAPNRFDTFSEIGTAFNQTTFEATNLNTTDFYHCFRLVASDLCSGAADLTSDTICSVGIRVDSLENENQITWSHPNLNFSSFELTKNGQVVLNSGNPSINTFIDDSINCNEENCYQVTYFYSNGLISRSGEVCRTFQTTESPPGISNVTPTVIDNSIQLDWSQNMLSDEINYRIFRRVNNGPFNLIDSLEAMEFIDENVDVAEDVHRYEIVYNDGCGNLSEPGETATPIRLTFQDNSNLSFQLNWNELTGWQNGVQDYRVQELDAEGNVIDDTSNGLSRTYIQNLEGGEQQHFFFRINALPNEPFLGNSFSNVLEIFIPARLFMPNAISPAASNPENRILQVNGLFVNSFELRVFNRWGELIHFSNEPGEGWDGNSENGEFVPQGIYVYNVNFTDFSGNTYKESGSVLLIR